LSPQAFITFEGSTRHLPKHVFVHKFKTDAVFCPWVEDTVRLSRCLKCPMNATHKLMKLDEDEVRGSGYIECNYTSEVTEDPPELIRKK